MDAFQDADHFAARVDGAIRQIHAAKRAPGIDRIYVPGEKEHLTRQAYEREGIPLNDVRLTEIRDTAMSHRVSTSASAAFARE